jgi:hypothetical protein
LWQADVVDISVGAVEKKINKNTIRASHISDSSTAQAHVNAPVVVDEQQPVDNGT